MPAPIDHGWDVYPVAISGGNIMRYRAWCACGETFELRADRNEAALDGIDHVRALDGRRLRRDELAEEAAEKKAASKQKRYAA